MKQINYKSDFDFILRLRDCEGNEVGWPGYGWQARFWTGQKVNAFVASCIGGEAVNCYNDDGKIHIVANSHRLSPGQLKVEFIAEIPNTDYPDSTERIVVPVPLEIELISTAAPCPEGFEVELVLPYVKISWQDLTPEQIAELKQPATEAAAEVKTLAAGWSAEEAKRRDAETLRMDAEAVRKQNEDARIVNETSRQDAEATRADNEAKRMSAESTRDASERTRVSQESARVNAESVRNTDEQQRKSDEQQRSQSEEARAEAERQRGSAESSRESNETKRVSSESARVEQEMERGSAEQDRKAAETVRVNAEAKRVEAESKRETAESKRASEFAGFKDEIASKADGADLSPVVGEFTSLEDGEELELRTGFTREDMKMDLFIDLFNAAVGTYGRYDPEDAPDPEHPFLLNGIWLTYGEAMASVTASYPRNSAMSFGFYYGTRCRTNIPVPNALVGLGQIWFANAYIEHAVINGTATISEPYAFYSCPKLKGITGVITVATDYMIGSCPLLTDMTVKIRAGITLHLESAPALSLDSYRYSVDNSSGCTIIVHPDVFARLTDGTDTEWHKVLTDAADKNIQFATI